ncbi:MAG: hypothetical protein RTU30_10095 [Candidatus Thorarchaeota archaeon]
MFQIDPEIKQNRSLYFAAIMQLIYGLVELVDCAAIVLITAGILPNLYVSFMAVDTELGVMLQNLPVIFIVIFVFFTSMRLISAVWIFENKVKGFWMALLVSAVTLVGVWFLLPFSVIDLAILCPFLILLFNGYFKDRPLLQGVD